MIKKLTLYKISFLALIMFIVTLSCKKDKSLGDENFPENAKSWYLDQASLTSSKLTSSNGSLKELIQKIDWSNATRHQLKNNIELLSVPVHYQFADGSKLKGDFILLILKDGGVYSSNLLYSENEGDFEKVNLTNKALESWHKKSIAVNGRNNILNVNERQLKIKLTPLASNGDDGGGGSTEDESAGCIDWYLVTTYYDSEGNYIGKIEEYMYTTCSEGESGGGGGGAGTGNEENVDPLQAYNKLCSSSFAFSIVVPSDDDGPGWKEASIKDLTINVVPENYFEAIWSSLAGGTLGKFNLTIGAPGDIPSSLLSQAAGKAVNKAMVDIYRSFGGAGVNKLIASGTIGTAIAKLAQIQLNAIYPGSRVSSGLSGNVTPHTPVIGVNCQ